MKRPLVGAYLYHHPYDGWYFTAVEAGRTPYPKPATWLNVWFRLPGIRHARWFVAWWLGRTEEDHLRCHAIERGWA